MVAARNMRYGSLIPVCEQQAIYESMAIYWYASWVPVLLKHKVTGWQACNQYRTTGSPQASRTHVTIVLFGTQVSGDEGEQLYKTFCVVGKVLVRYIMYGTESL